MKKSTIINFLKEYKYEILFWTAVIIGTIVVGNCLDNVYNTHFINWVETITSNK